MEQATRKYSAHLPASPAAEYLESRGIPGSVAATFRLGYVGSPERGHEHAEGRLAIPYITPRGVIDIKFRALDPEDRLKYVSIGGNGPARLFNVRALHASEAYVAITEGELDAVVMHGLCDVPAVGIAGVNNWHKYFKRLFEDYDRVLIIMDDDEAGEKAAQKIRKELRNGLIVSLGTGGDVNETYLSKGPEYIRERLGLE